MLHLVVLSLLCHIAVGAVPRASGSVRMPGMGPVVRATTAGAAPTTSHWIKIPTTKHQSLPPIKCIPASVDSSGNRRILPAPAISPIIRVTNPMRSMPTTLTIHPNKGNGNGSFITPLPGSLHKAAVIATNATTTQRLLPSQNVILGHNQSRSAKVLTSLAGSGAAQSPAVLTTASLPGAAGLHCPTKSIASLGPASASAETLVDLTADGESSSMPCESLSVPMTALNDRKCVAGAISVVCHSPTISPSSAVILHTPIIQAITQTTQG